MGIIVRLRALINRPAIQNQTYGNLYYALVGNTLYYALVPGPDQAIDSLKYDAQTAKALCQLNKQLKRQGLID